MMGSSVRKIWVGAIVVTMGLMGSSGAASAQERDWDRLAERIARAVERAVLSAEEATYRALEALEDADIQVDWSGEDWEDTSWFWDDEGAGPRTQEEFRWEGRVDRGDVLEIKGINGPIRAVAASGRDVEVVALKSGRRSNPSEVRIEVVEHSGGVTLCAVYPSRGSEENQCGVGGEGRSSVKRNDVSVEWEVRVPRDVLFRGQTVNGGVEAIGLTADVDVATVNGDLIVETEGFGSARTVNGSIEARLGGFPSSDVAFETVNGSIDLDVENDLNADLDASWLSGSLDTDLPVSMQGRMGRRSAQGQLGNGGPLLSIRTVNGSITLR